MYLINNLVRFVNELKEGGKKSAAEALGTQFGFKKMFLMLTEVGKVVAVSATDGQVLWSHYFGENIPSKILVRTFEDREFNGENGQNF